MTVRYELVDRDGAITGDFGLVLPDALSASGSVRGNRNKQAYRAKRGDRAPLVRRSRRYCSD